MSGAPAPSKEADLLTIAYTSDAPMKFPALPTSYREITPLDTTNAVPRSFVLSESGMSYMINGKMFDPLRVDFSAKLNDTEVWTVTNNADMDHPFHVHGFQFQVIDRAGVAAPVVAWTDTVNLPKKTSLHLAVKLDMPGMRMYHCHILEHEDLGMMGMLEVK